MSEKIKVLFAEDETFLAQIVQESLETKNFEVYLASDGNEALNIYQKNNLDILVLDVMMPKKDGFTLAKEIRQLDDNIPIIFLTAKSETEDVLEGFSVGGNDYLKKPFSMKELIVRIDSLIQRKKIQEEPKIFEIGQYIFNFPKQTLSYKKENILLTHRETHLLFHLYSNKNQVLDRSLILKKLWGNDDFFNSRSMDVFISKLRKKLSKDKNVQIVNVRGFGYKLII